MVCSLANALDITDEPRVITRGSPPFSILHTNKAWSTLTGYKFAEVVNRSTSFLQGPETERDQLLKLQVACQQGQHAKVRVLNYTKEGEPFVNSLEVHPLRDAEGVLTHWCGVLRGEKAPKFTKTLMREAAVQPSSSSSSSRSSAGATSSATPMPAAATAARGGSRRAAAQHGGSEAEKRKCPASGCAEEVAAIASSRHNQRRQWKCTWSFHRPRICRQ